jgi:heme oxygenase (biliverdin-producing, ferredoxin)
MLFLHFKVQENSQLAQDFTSTGLERSDAIKKSVEWLTEYDKSLTIPQQCNAGDEYSNYLISIAKESVPKFFCHYYNYYFAHTAGGRMIGAQIAEDLLDGNVLDFYKWERDVKEILEETREKIENVASKWNDVERSECLDETKTTFIYNKKIMASLSSNENVSS